MAKMHRPRAWSFEPPIPTIQSPTRAVLRMSGLQVASVQTPWKGFGAKPKSRATTYMYSLGIDTQHLEVTVAWTGDRDIPSGVSNEFWLPSIAAIMLSVFQPTIELA